MANRGDAVLSEYAHIYSMLPMFMRDVPKQIIGRNVVRLPDKPWPPSSYLHPFPSNESISRSPAGVVFITYFLRQPPAFRVQQFHKLKLPKFPISPFFHSSARQINQLPTTALPTCRSPWSATRMEKRSPSKSPFSTPSVVLLPGDPKLFSLRRR
jgi:hypothetical protein